MGGAAAEQRRIAAVARQARRLSGLIDGMLDVSRFTRRASVARAGAGGRRRAGARGVAAVLARRRGRACPLSLRLDTPLVALLDANRMDQIITNLIGNALKYGAGAPIEMSVEGDNDASIYRARSRHRHLARRPGAHVPRFERAAESASTAGGPGAVDHSELVKALGGRIGLQSVPGAGAEFTVVLPRRPTTIVERRQPQKQRSTG